MGQRDAIGRLRVLAGSWARDSDGVSLSSSRKGPMLAELVQRVEERAQDILAAVDPYCVGAPRALRSVLRPNGVDPSRLKFGPQLGGFSLARWLSPPLGLALDEPAVLRHIGANESRWAWPPTSDLKEGDLIGLFEKLSGAGILWLSARQTRLVE